MTRVIVEFDGKVFVPQEPVNLPVGAKVAVSIPSAIEAPSASSFTAEEDRDWERMLALIRQGEPEPETVDEAMREIRGRP